MAKKSNYAKVAAGEMEGLQPSAKSLPKNSIPKEDTQEFQEEVLKAKQSKYNLILADDEVVPLPMEFNVEQAYIERFEKRLNKILQLTNYYAAKITGQDYNIVTFVADEGAIQIALGEDTIHREIEEFLATLTKKPLSAFKDKVKQFSALVFMRWIVEYFNNKYGASNAKNDK